MSNGKVAYGPAVPLPGSVHELLQQRIMPFERTMNDRTETIMVKLFENEHFKALIVATHDGEALEGAVVCDDVLASEMIRTEAKKLGGDPVVALAKLGSIKNAMRVVLRRYRISRKQRKNLLGGEQVAPDSDGSNGSDE